MCTPTKYQKIVTKRVYNKRFSELDCQERAKVNIYIAHRGYYAVQQFPHLIKESFEVVLKGARESEKKSSLTSERLLSIPLSLHT
jgi:hypothetical protein